MHEMLTILTDVRDVCLQCTPPAVCAGLFGAAFVKCFWPLVILLLALYCSNCSCDVATCQLFYSDRLLIIYLYLVCRTFQSVIRISFISLTLCYLNLCYDE